VGRDYDPVPGQWYENLEEEETFQVLTVDEDSELIEIQYLDGDVEEIDLETWTEMDLEKRAEPEGWSGSEGEEEDDADTDEDDDDDDDDDDWDDDDDEDDDDFDDDDEERENY
jgi:segregation and condensation protein B